MTFRRLLLLERHGLGFFCSVLVSLLDAVNLFSDGGVLVSLQVVVRATAVAALLFLVDDGGVDSCHLQKIQTRRILCLTGARKLCQEAFFTGRCGPSILYSLESYHRPRQGLMLTAKATTSDKADNSQ